MFREPRAEGEPYKKEANVSDIINAKYEELQSARRMKRELESQNSVPMIPSKAQALADNLRKLELVIPQLEQQFEELKGGRAENLEKRFGSISSNDDTVLAPLITESPDVWSNDQYLGGNSKGATAK